MTIRRTNPRKQGEIGLAAAINHFVGHGYAVAIPLADNQPWDLIVDDGSGPQRVQVKTTTSRSRSGYFAVGLRTNGGNRSRSTSKHFDTGGSDILFVLTDAQDRYVLPTSALHCRSELTLGPKFEAYRCGDPSAPRAT